jgi:hypothetical protein
MDSITLDKIQKLINISIDIYNVGVQRQEQHNKMNRSNYPPDEGQKKINSNLDARLSILRERKTEIENDLQMLVQRNNH